MVSENGTGKLEIQFHDFMEPDLGSVGTEALILMVKSTKFCQLIYKT